MQSGATVSISGGTVAATITVQSGGSLTIGGSTITGAITTPGEAQMLAITDSAFPAVSLLSLISLEAEQLHLDLHSADNAWTLSRADQASAPYAVALASSASINTVLTVRSGQSVRITGAGSQALPSWGSGGFTVQQFGTLSLTGVLLEGGLIVQSGGSLTIGGSTVSGTITVQSGGSLSLTGR